MLNDVLDSLVKEPDVLEGCPLPPAELGAADYTSEQQTRMRPISFVDPEGIHDPGWPRPEQAGVRPQKLAREGLCIRLGRIPGRSAFQAYPSSLQSTTLLRTERLNGL